MLGGFVYNRVDYSLYSGEEVTYQVRSLHTYNVREKQGQKTCPQERGTERRKGGPTMEREREEEEWEGFSSYAPLGVAFPRDRG